MRDGAAGDEIGAQRQRDRLRRWSCHCTDAGHRGGGQATGGERSEPPGQTECGLSEAKGGARDGRPKGGDRVAGSAGQPGREATPPKTKPDSATPRQSSAASQGSAEDRRPAGKKGTARSLASARERRRSRGTVRRRRRRTDGRQRGGSVDGRGDGAFDVLHKSTAGVRRSRTAAATGTCVDSSIAG